MAMETGVEGFWAGVAPRPATGRVRPPGCGGRGLGGAAGAGSLSVCGQRQRRHMQERGRGGRGRPGERGGQARQVLARQAQGGRHPAGGGEPLDPVLGQGLRQHRHHRVGHHALEGRRLLDLLQDRGHRGVAPEGHPAGEQLEDHDAQRVDVGAEVELVAEGLLRAHVLRGAHHLAGHGEAHRLQLAGDAEVHEADDAARDRA